MTGRAAVGPIVPCDLPAEDAICALLLRGETTPERLLPLRPKHHYSLVHEQIHGAAEAVTARGEMVGLSTLAAELERRGVLGEFREDLEEIRAFGPLLTARGLEEHKQRIIELWGRRQLADVLFRTENGLRVGELNSAAARARLEACVREVFGP